MRDEPAFPIVMGGSAREDSFISSKGMTLRDYLAAHAMQGYIQSDATHGAYDWPDEDMLEIAHWSYRMSDQMLKVRDQK